MPTIHIQISSIFLSLYIVEIKSAQIYNKFEAKGIHDGKARQCMCCHSLVPRPFGEVGGNYSLTNL